MRAYNRMSMAEYAGNVDIAARAVIAIVQTNNMPICEQFNFFLVKHAIVKQTE
jgi:hypothetical protein